MQDRREGRVQKLLIILGCIFIVAGILWPWLVKSGLGRLPGDLLIKREGFTFYFPIMTTIILSVVLSLILWLINK